MALRHAAGVVLTVLTVLFTIPARAQPGPRTRPSSPARKKRAKIAIMSRNCLRAFFGPTNMAVIGAGRARRRRLCGEGVPGQPEPD